MAAQSKEKNNDTNKDQPIPKGDVPQAQSGGTSVQKLMKIGLEFPPEHKTDNKSFKPVQEAHKLVANMATQHGASVYFTNKEQTKRFHLYKDFPSPEDYPEFFSLTETNTRNGKKTFLHFNLLSSIQFDKIKKPLRAIYMDASKIYMREEKTLASKKMKDIGMIIGQDPFKTNLEDWKDEVEGDLARQFKINFEEEIGNNKKDKEKNKAAAMPPFEVYRKQVRQTFNAVQYKTWAIVVKGCVDDAAVLDQKLRENNIANDLGEYISYDATAEVKAKMIQTHNDHTDQDNLTHIPVYGFTEAMLQCNVPKNQTFAWAEGLTFRRMLKQINKKGRTLFLESVERTKFTSERGVVWFVTTEKNKDNVKKFIDTELIRVMQDLCPAYNEHHIKHPESKQPHYNKGRNQSNHPKPEDPSWKALHPNDKITDPAVHVKYNGRRSQRKQEVPHVIDWTKAEIPPPTWLQAATNNKQDKTPSPTTLATTTQDEGSLASAEQSNVSQQLTVNTVETMFTKFTAGIDKREKENRSFFTDLMEKQNKLIEQQAEKHEKAMQEERKRNVEQQNRSDERFDKMLQLVMANTPTKPTKKQAEQPPARQEPVRKRAAEEAPNPNDTSIMSVDEEKEEEATGGQSLKAASSFGSDWTMTDKDEQQQQQQQLTQTEEEFIPVIPRGSPIRKPASPTLQAITAAGSGSPPKSSLRLAAAKEKTTTGRGSIGRGGGGRGGRGGRGVDTRQGHITSPAKLNRKEEPTKPKLAALRNKANTPNEQTRTSTRLRENEASKE
jgi:hypothetical protein